jgi:hypothetical protein
MLDRACGADDVEPIFGTRLRAETSVGSGCGIGPRAGCGAAEEAKEPHSDRAARPSGMGVLLQQIGDYLV